MALELGLTNSLLLISIIILTLGAAFSIKDRRIGFIASIIAIVVSVASLTAETYFYGVFVAAIGLLNIFCLYISQNQIKGIDYALVALMVLATVWVILSNNFAVILATFVLVSVPTYVLVLTGEKDLKLEVGIKYITFMVFATVLFLIGSLLLVFSSQVFSAQASPILYIIGYVFLILGLSLEVGVAPLHEWVPDVFAAADAIPISIVASLAKIVPFIVAFKILIATSTPLTESITLFTAFLAVVSMFVGNIGALTSREHGRVLGYSTVANMGYVLATLVAIVRLEFVYLAIAGALLQLFANSAGKIGFFTAIKKEGMGSPFTYALALSFIGMPPLMGFWSKLFITLSLVNSGYLWLAVLLVLNSAISVPYYLRLARELGKGRGTGIVNLIGLLVTLLVIVTLYPPDWFLQGVKGVVVMFGISGISGIS
ncbi:MAG: NADH-quinone oxidoreductase subunit N [Archaeoglobus sp.]|nr:NADH-quinone oxidoreductase subunit N [Archaeoglobus sp.]